MSQNVQTRALDRRSRVILRVLPLLLALPFVLVSTPKAEAVSCRQVANLNEEWRLANLREENFGYKSKSSIAFGYRVYKVSYQNQQCISSSQVSGIVDFVSAIQDACKVRRASDPEYEDWKKFSRDYWASLFGNNFKFACSRWKKFRL